MTRDEFKKAIPHGYGKKIAKEAGVTQRSVSLFLKGKINSIKIEMAALKVLAELGNQKRELIEQIN